ncbi:MAG: hypothetical protein PF442_00855 [Desulfobulbaceae bacterium]|jgi:hypothetical protein|nr:hypothetical protein [Desulfobulbaceae bacterium]
MKFTPLKFQGTLAAAGVALMPYVFLKVNIFKSDGQISLSDLSLLISPSLEYVIAWLLIAIMASFIVIHLSLTAIFFNQLIKWLANPSSFKEILHNPLTSASLFSPLISLPMTMIVLFGPVSFFVPQITANMQALMAPAFVMFSLLWLLLLALEIKAIQVFLTNQVDYTSLNFGWLLDVLALGAVSLFGASLVNASENYLLSTTAAVMVSISLVLGVVVFAFKMSVLVYQQMQSADRPTIHILPAYFLFVPPMCLLGFSSFKLMMFTDKSYGIDLSTASFLTMTFSYTGAMVWFVFAVYWLREYLGKEFLSSDFSPAQWGMV